jgi:hypothetical protein
VAKLAGDKNNVCAFTNQHRGEAMAEVMNP